MGRNNTYRTSTVSNQNNTPSTNLRHVNDADHIDFRFISDPFLEDDVNYRRRHHL